MYIFRNVGEVTQGPPEQFKVRLFAALEDIDLALQTIQDSGNVVMFVVNLVNKAGYRNGSLPA